MEMYGHDKQSWPFFPKYRSIMNNIIYHVGIVDNLQIDDILEIMKMEPAPYDIYSSFGY